MEEKGRFIDSKNKCDSDKEAKYEPLIDKVLQRREKLGSLRGETEKLGRVKWFS